MDVQELEAESEARLKDKRKALTKLHKVDLACPSKAGCKRPSLAALLLLHL